MHIPLTQGSQIEKVKDFRYARIVYDAIQHCHDDLIWIRTNWIGEQGAGIADVTTGKDAQGHAAP